MAAARRQVGVDVAYLAEFGLSGATVRAVSGDGASLGVAVGDVVPFAESICMASVSGNLPSVVADTRQDRATRRLAWQREVPMGAYAAAPVRTTDGVLFGGLCLAHRSPRAGLHAGTEQFMFAIAEVIGDELTIAQAATDQSSRERFAILGLLDDGCMSTVLQPVVDLVDGHTVGVEALTRFAVEPARPPNLWFSAAARHGLAVELEAAAISRALRVAPTLPPEWFLSVNASPALIEADVIGALLTDADADRLVIEITEHAPVDDYGTLSDALAPLRERGVRVAVDDAGAGFSSLRHVVRLQPDILKIDGSLVRGIDAEPLHRAMVESLVSFSDHGDALVVAEAVETPQELEALQELGVPTAQGYLFAAPCPRDDLRAQYPVAIPSALRTRG